MRIAIGAALALLISAGSALAFPVSGDLNVSKLVAGGAISSGVPNDLNVSKLVAGGAISAGVPASLNVSKIVAFAVLVPSTTSCGRMPLLGVGC
jgi:uncharacterized protein YgbK (DUF1537 family)